MKWSCILTEGVEPLFSALLGAVQRHGSWHVLLPKKRLHLQAAWLAQQQHRAEVRQKGSKKIVGAQLETSMAGDVHSGGQDWHPSAGMRYRLVKSEMGISRQWRAAL
jgi:hypothetical protein